MVKTLMLVTGDAEYDTRVKREKETLMEQGHEVWCHDWKRDEYEDKFITIIKLIFWTIKAYIYLRNCNFDVIHCHNFDTLFLGVMLKRKWGCLLYYDAHEMYAHMVQIKLILPFEKLFMSNANKIIAVSTPVRKYLRWLGGEDITIVQNCKPIMEKKYNPPKTKDFTFSYFGVLTEDRLYPDIVEYLGDFKKTKLVIGGYGLQTEKVKEISKHFENIDFKGYVTEQEVFKHTLESDIVLSLFDPSNLNSRGGMPNKFFECLVLGRPMIVTKGTHIAELVKKHSIGFVVEHNVGSLGKLLHEDNLKEKCIRYGKNALQLGLNYYNWETEKQKLINLY